MTPYILISEFKRWHSGDIRLHAKYAARLRILSQRSRIHADAGRSDEQLIHIGSAKNTGGDLQGRNGKLFEQRAVRFPLRDPRAVPHRDPKIAIHIGSHAIGKAEGVGKVNDTPRIGNLAGFDIVIKSLYIFCWCINEIQGLVIGRPGNAVRNANILKRSFDTSIHGKRIQRTAGFLLIVIHRPGNEAPSADRIYRR